MPILEERVPARRDRRALRDRRRRPGSGPQNRIRWRRVLVAGTVLLGVAAVLIWALSPVGPAGPDGDATVTLDTTDDQGLQVGVRIVATGSAVVTAIRFNPGAGDRTSRTASIWDDRGRLLAAGSALVARRGWRTAPMSTPVTLVAGRTYTIGYLAVGVSDPADAGTDETTPTSPFYRVLSLVHGRSGMPAEPLPGTGLAVQISPAGLGVGTALGTPAPPSGSATAGPATTAAPTAASTATGPAGAGSPGPSAPAGSGPATAPRPSDGTAKPPGPAPGSPGSRPVGTGCAADPSRCGYPDAGTTGVPTGTTLRSVPGDVSSGKGWSFDKRGWVTVSGDGAVLENLDIPYSIDVTASNVVIRNVRVRLGGEGFGISLRRTDNVTITRSEITAPDAGSNRLMVGIKDIYSDSTDLTVSGTDISRTSTGIQVDAGLLEGNYIHDLGFVAGDHVNGITSNSANGQWLVIRGNTVLNRHDQTDAISLFQDFGEQRRRIIDGNLVAGGGYTIYGGANAGKPTPTDVRITGNRFSRMYFRAGGRFGPLTAVAGSGSGNVVANNIWDDTGAAVR